MLVKEMENGGTVINELAAAWREVDVAERLLVCRHFNEAAERATAALTRLKEVEGWSNQVLPCDSDNPESHGGGGGGGGGAIVEALSHVAKGEIQVEAACGISSTEAAEVAECVGNGREVAERELSALERSAGMVIIQAHHESGRDGESVEAMRGAFTSMRKVPQEVILAWACLLASGGNHACAKAVLEEYLFDKVGAKECGKEPTAGREDTKLSAYSDDRSKSLKKDFREVSEKWTAAIWEIYLIHVLAKGCSNFKQAEALLTGSDSCGPPCLQLQGREKQALLNKLQAIREEVLQVDSGQSNVATVLVSSSKKGTHIGRTSRAMLPVTGDRNSNSLLKSEENGISKRALPRPGESSQQQARDTLGIVSEGGPHEGAAAECTLQSREAPGNAHSEMCSGRQAAEVSRRGAVVHTQTYSRKFWRLLEFCSSWVIGLAMRLVSRANVSTFPAVQKWVNWVDIKGTIGVTMGLVFAYALSKEWESLSRSASAARVMAAQYVKDAWALAFSVNLNPVAVTHARPRSRALTATR